MMFYDIIMEVLKSICFTYVHFIMKCGVILGCYSFNCKKCLFYKSMLYLMNLT